MENNNRKTYQGNDRLKAAGVPIAYEQWQIDEFKKCEQNYLYFIENYNYIVSLDSQDIQLIKLRDYQVHLLDTVHNNKFTICCIPRQSGKSSSIAMYIVWSLIFQDNYSIGIAADKAETAQEIMDRIKLTYENLPMWLQQGVIKWNERSIKLENGSRVVASSTTTKTFRGQSHNLVLLDEFAFVDRNIADPFYTSIYPVISSGKDSKMVIVSTPKGMNHFHKLWTESSEGRSSFKPVSIKWTQVPGRDEKFKQETISNIGQEKWDQEFEAQFIGGTNTLISSTKLSELTFIEPLSKADKVEYYQLPILGHSYFMSVDVSEGKGQDYHAATIIDITERPFRVVCTYKCNTTPSLLLPEILSRIGNFYNKAYCLVESKSDGGQVADILFNDSEYDNLLGAEKKGRLGQTLTLYKRNARGLSTSATTKSIGCSNLKLLTETNQIIFNSFNIIEELSNFCLSGSSYKANPGYNDDLIMTLVNFSWATTQPFFQNFTNSGSIRQIFDLQVKEIEDNLIPFGIIIDDNYDTNLMNSNFFNS